MYFHPAARTYEILKVRSEVIIENWSNTNNNMARMVEKKFA
jgi:hypothetical protein